MRSFAKSVTNTASCWLSMRVMAGFGRSGKMFAFEHYDYTPDLVTFAKGVTSSYAPLGGVMVRKGNCAIN